ncbi:MAG: hypothetical protein HZC38_13475 [Chloroflexi bacterium]|nr:hypothetical protein [Chloroflexota bacterium]
MIAALVCGRADNQPFPGRNTFPLLGRPLMVYPLLAALHASEVEAVFLTTDDPGMARVGNHYGARVIDRPPELRRATSTLEEVIAHGNRAITELYGESPEILVVLLANAPTITSDVIDQGIRSLQKDSGIDVVMTVSKRNLYAPANAFRLATSGLLLPYNEQIPVRDEDVYYADALLWVLRPGSYFDDSVRSVSPNWIVNAARHRIAPLVHDGYSDVDYDWQIPAIEEWLRRRGFTEDATPYAPAKTAQSSSPKSKGMPSLNLPDPKTSPEKRVLITTVPFGQADRKPLELLESNGIDYVINPIGRRLKENELADMIRDFGVLIAGTEPITAKVMEAAPHLKLIARVGIGLDSVDLIVARERGIQVAYTPDAPSPAVAELTVGLMICLLRDIPGADRTMRNGVWHRFMGRRLSEMTVGIIGVGRIGKKVIQHIRGGFPSAHILANDIAPDTSFGDQYNVQWVDKETIYREADIISLHLPLTPHTHHLIGVEQIALMKPTTVLVNTSRGNMMVEHDLAMALREGRIAGAAIDVFEREPYSGELATLDRCILTCHMGSMSQDCRAQMEIEATEDAVRFLRGEAVKGVVPESEYVLIGTLGR